MKLIFTLFFTCLLPRVEYLKLANDRNTELSNKNFQEGILPVLDGFSGRKVIKMPTIILDQKGRIVTKICVNRKGLVTYVEYNQDESTEMGRATIKNLLKQLRVFEFEPDYNHKEQCGKLTFTNP